jgi:hypothetical protein
MNTPDERFSHEVIFPGNGRGSESRQNSVRATRYSLVLWTKINDHDRVIDGTARMEVREILERAYEYSAG